MRNLKRWLRRHWAEWAIRGRRQALRHELQTALALPTLPTLLRSGARGHDSNYKILHHGQIVGMLRLLNPHKKRALPTAHSPFVALEPQARLAHEWECYRIGAPLHLTPTPLWRTHDAIVTAYVPAATGWEIYQAHPEKLWDLLLCASVQIHAWHQHTGTSHMDASLLNFLIGDACPQGCLIDFEYAPAPTLSWQQQCVYDHLRLLESLWKFLSASEKQGCEAWIVQLSRITDLGSHQIDLAPLTPALGRILNDPIFLTPWKAHFPTIAPYRPV